MWPFFFPVFYSGGGSTHIVHDEPKKCRHDIALTRECGTCAAEQKIIETQKLAHFKEISDRKIYTNAIEKGALSDGQIPAAGTPEAQALFEARYQKRFGTTV